MRTHLRLGAVTIAGTVLGAACLVGAPALASWAKGGVGEGAARAGSLVAPTDVTAAGASSTAITITWSAADQLSGATYRVLRNGTTALSCTSSPCTDSGLTAGTTYSYVVSSKIGTSWSRSAAAVSGTTTNAQVGASTLDVSSAASVTAGSTLPVTITAKRSDGTTDTAFSGTKIIDWTGTARSNAPNGVSPTLPSSATFVNGVVTVSITLVHAGTSLDLTATVGGLNGTKSMAVDAGAPAGLLPTSMLMNGVPRTCTPPINVTAVNCGPYSGGNNNASAARFLVSLIDTYGNLSKATTAVSIAGARVGSQGSLSASPMTIPAGSSSTGQWTWGSPTGNWTSETLRFTASGWTLNVTVTK